MTAAYQYIRLESLIATFMSRAGPAASHSNGNSSHHDGTQAIIGPASQAYEDITVYGWEEVRAYTGIKYKMTLIDTMT